MFLYEFCLCKVDEKNLMEAYGKDVSIDLATGEIKENVEEAQTVEE